jgi:hypothetical protein
LTRVRLITLSRTQFLFVALSLLLLAALCCVAVFFPIGVYDFKCRQLDLPGYQATFGFTLGELEAPSSGGGSHRVLAITALTPNGPLARSGARVGDVPPSYHGISDFCGDLAAATEGQSIPIRVYNLSDAEAGKEPWREIELRLR